MRIIQKYPKEEIILSVSCIHSTVHTHNGIEAPNSQVTLYNERKPVIENFIGQTMVVNIFTVDRLPLPCNINQSAPTIQLKKLNKEERQ